MAITVRDSLSGWNFLLEKEEEKGNEMPSANGTKEGEREIALV